MEKNSIVKSKNSIFRMKLVMIQYGAAYFLLISVTRLSIFRKITKLNKYKNINSNLSNIYNW